MVSVDNRRWKLSIQDAPFWRTNGYCPPTTRVRGINPSGSIIVLRAQKTPEAVTERGAFIGPDTASSVPENPPIYALRSFQLSF